MSDSTPSEIQINIKGPSELKLQITISTDKTVLELKEAVAAQSNVEADRQRLIYSGRVLKDEDPLTNYKIQSGHTIHMVKGVSRSTAATTSSGAPPQQIPTMQTGQNVHDPLTQLNSHMGFGAMAGFNPFADMGLNPNDPNLMNNMMDSPEFIQQMSSVMSNPAVVDQLIASNPQLAAMGPQVRELFQSERFRQIMSNPDQLRSIMQMSSALRGAGLGPGGADPFGGLFGGAGGGASFPAPGVPTTGAPTPSSNSTGTGATSNPNPGGGAASVGAGLGANPFAALGGLPNPGAGAGASPFGDPAQMLQQLQQMQQMFGTAGGAGATPGGNPFLAGLGGLGGGLGGAPSAAPADTRSPEERFQVQLQQLQDMGFTNAQQNVRALLATGGNVHSAIEYILGGGGL